MLEKNDIINRLTALDKISVSFQLQPMDDEKTILYSDTFIIERTLISGERSMRDVVYLANVYILREIPKYIASKISENPKLMLEDTPVPWLEITELRYQEKGRGEWISLRVLTPKERATHLLRWNYKFCSPDTPVLSAKIGPFTLALNEDETTLLVGTEKDVKTLSVDAQGKMQLTR